MYQMMVPNQLVQWAWREQNKNSFEEDTIISIIIKMITSIVLHSSMASNLLNTAHMTDSKWKDSMVGTEDNTSLTKAMDRTSLHI